MALQTPRPREIRPPRPSLGQQNINTASSPNLSLSASTAIARKASLNALTGGQVPTTPGKMIGGDGRDIEVGDTVDVPGGMHGTVKFVGTVKGKKGTFAGVELSREYSARGKNDGDVEGYVCTTIGSKLNIPLCEPQLDLRSDTMPNSETNSPH
jgi:hypothetical protein